MMIRWTRATLTVPIGLQVGGRPLPLAPPHAALRGLTAGNLHPPNHPTDAKAPRPTHPTDAKAPRPNHPTDAKAPRPNHPTDAKAPRPNHPTDAKAPRPN